MAARGHDAGAAWYNPAGLAALDRSVLSLSASAYMWRRYDIAAFLQTRLYDDEALDGVVHNEVDSVPSALVFAHELTPTVTGALALFVPDVESLWFLLETHRADVTPAGTPYTLDQSLRIVQLETTYMAGPAVGWEVLPELRVGASLLGVLSRARFMMALGSDLAEAGGGGRLAFSDVNDGEDLMLGLMATLGVQWEPAPGWHVGLVARSPGLRVWRSAAMHHELLLADLRGAPAADGAGVHEAAEKNGIDPGLVVPGRLVLALAYDLAHGWAGAELELAHAMDGVEGRRSELVWNARLGLLWDFDAAWSLGLGLFTDLNDDPDAAQLGNSWVDFAGASLGGQWRTELALRDDDEPLVILTTAALRFALGFGDFGGFSLTPLAPDASTPGVYRSDAAYQELGLHIGSAIAF